jgi:hypothetical protein
LRRALHYGSHAVIIHLQTPVHIAHDPCSLSVDDCRLRSQRCHMNSQGDGRYCHLSKDQPPSSPQGYGWTVAKIPLSPFFSCLGHIGPSAQDSHWAQGTSDHTAELRSFHRAMCDVRRAPYCDVLCGRGSPCITAATHGSSKTRGKLCSRAGESLVVVAHHREA